MLWPLNKCFDNKDISVLYTDTGSDGGFETPELCNFGKGTLFVRKKDKSGEHHDYFYTNFLEANAVKGPNTRIDLNEEGEYEIALDYQLRYKKKGVFGLKFKKTYSYRMNFKFTIANGDVSGYVRNIKNGEFVKDREVVEGFRIDLAGSRNLKIKIKNEKINRVANDKEEITDPGTYTITIENPATREKVKRTVVVKK